MPARRRSRGGFRRKKQNVEWANNSAVTPVPVVAGNSFIELVPDAMSGLVLAPDFLIKRIVGSFTFTPQSSATATTTVGMAIIRSTHQASGAVETAHDPLSTDVDSGSSDILWQEQFQPEYGGGLDATALDLAWVLKIDLRAKGSLRKLDKRHGIQLIHRAETTARVEFTFRLRILSGLSA